MAQTATNRQVFFEINYSTKRGTLCKGWVCPVEPLPQDRSPADVTLYGFVKTNDSLVKGVEMEEVNKTKIKFNFKKY